MNTMAKNVLLAPFNLLYQISPEACLKALFWMHQGYKLDFEHPKTFSEKIQWIKLYDRNPLMPICADKWRVRSYVEERGCGDYLNELLWHGTDPNQIPFDSLPGRYVVKVTHGSTFNVIVDGTHPVDRDSIRGKCYRWLGAKFLPCYGEWFYGRSGGVEPSIVVERFLDNGSGGGLDDYKIFVMNGHPVLTLVCTGRTAGSHFEDYFDNEWNPIPNVDMGERRSGKCIQRPACHEEMLRLAGLLAAPFHHARIDFYVVDGQPVFGEITFTSGSGFDKFHPYQFDLWLGNQLHLPCDEMRGKL